MPAGGAGPLPCTATSSRASGGVPPPAEGGRGLDGAQEPERLLRERGLDAGKREERLRAPERDGRVARRGAGPRALDEVRRARLARAEPVEERDGLAGRRGRPRGDAPARSQPRRLDEERMAARDRGQRLLEPGQRGSLPRGRELHPAQDGALGRVELAELGRLLPGPLARDAEHPRARLERAGPRGEHAAVLRQRDALLPGALGEEREAEPLLLGVRARRRHRARPLAEAPREERAHEGGAVDAGGHAGARPSRSTTSSSGSSVGRGPRSSFGERIWR